MKIKKGKIVLSIDPDEWEKFSKNGWEKKFERHPDKTKEYLKTQKERKAKCSQDNNK